MKPIKRLEGMVYEPLVKALVQPAHHRRPTVHRQHFAYTEPAFGPVTGWDLTLAGFILAPKAEAILGPLVLILPGIPQEVQIEVSFREGLRVVPPETGQFLCHAPSQADIEGL